MVYKHPRVYLLCKFGGGGWKYAIYFKDGHVAYFEQVKNFRQDPEYLRFEYFGIASQQSKSAVFFHSNMAGYSFSK